MAFIAADNKEKKDKEQQEKQAMSTRQDKEDRLKKLEMEISQIRSDIEKHKDALGDLLMHQRFILELSPDDFRAKRELEKKTQKEQAFKVWKQRYLVDDTQDDIIFGEDEEIHESIKLESIEDNTTIKQTQSKQTYGGTSKKDVKQAKMVSRQNCSEQWLA